MAAKFYVLAIVSVVVGAAPPTYRQHAPAHLQQIQPFEYYLQNQDVANYYGQTQQRQASSNGQRGAPSRLETLEPDSEVELIPGAQQPQQPPQQNPVAPNLPGLIPGQRVFIVHMPVPGYRPGSIGGYQPVYIVAAAPQANAGYPHNVINGYQNAVLLDPSGQAVYSPLPLAPQQPAYLLAPQLQSPQLQSLKAPYDTLYQQPIAYQQAQSPAGQETRRPVHLSQLIALQNANAANNPRSSSSSSSNESSSNAASESTESKESEEHRRNARPLPPHAQSLKSQ
ncbi:unnamed protein product [Chilo suppressalis]|uniref:DUF4794 domain-containing protein n=1 Tax=Chilo suppressalis TaxID=168631 RepID=A0ABN8BJ82_CHISP|nr:unnamed protein product [Chilo suppressalis]